MDKIAFYISLKKQEKIIYNAEFSLGNPGIGGTQYLYLITVKYINEILENKKAVLLSDIDYINDKHIININVGSLNDAIKYCEANNFKCIVINGNEVLSNKLAISGSKICVYVWAHNTINFKQQRYINKTKSIKKIICVSENQYQNMLDTICYKKCCYINNIISSDFYKNCKKSNYLSEDVIYVGSIFPQKGVHNLLEIWNEVEKQCPNARLKIIGGSKVWDSNSQIGSLGVADPFYEKIIQRKLKKLKSKNNVEFLGVMSWEKINGLLETARLGVVNPSYYFRDETFCMSAIELQAHGLPIVSRMRNDGLITTIKHNITGYLEKKNKMIANRIIEIIKNDNLCNEMGKNALMHSKEFLEINEINKWFNLNDIPLKKRKIFFKKDTFLLLNDKIHKICFLISSGKIIKILKYKITKKRT